MLASSSRLVRCEHECRPLFRESYTRYHWPI